jgi:PAS domain S-box-containing protein
MSDPIHILYVDDYPLDRELVRDALEKEHSGFLITEATSRKDFEARLAEGDYDLVLSDFNILGFEGLQVLDAVHAKDPSTPVIIVTGTGSEEVAVEALKRGAADYVIKTTGHIRRLPVTIHAVLEKNRLKGVREQVEEALRHSEARLSNAMKIARLGYWEYDVAEGLFTFNDHFYAIFRTSAEKVGGYKLAPTRYAELFLPPEDRSIVAAELKQSLETADPHYSRQLEHRIIYADGEIGYISVSFFIIKDNQGRTIKTYGANQDITERKRREEALRESESKYRTLVENIPQRIFTKDRDSVYVSCNGNFAKDCGVRPGQVTGKTDYDFFPIQLADKYRRDDMRIMETGQTEEFEEKYIQGGEEIWVQTIKTPIRQENGGITGILGVFRDVTEQKLAQVEKEKLQQQLNQAQKLESIGRLAGGVAHDYNNFLSVIIGYSELAQLKIGPEDPLREDLNQILSAAKRSRDLTRQLLAFARKETIMPEVLDLNATVENMLKILRKLIGEDIDLFWHPGKVPGPVLMDPSQLDQIMANLCINARDAITDVGKITIETGAATIDEEYCSEHTGFKPGEFVLLAVSDDGYGMEKEMVDHIFEPFFTTKGETRGTGLGLSTVYGIVKQNNGFINVYSEPGRGTTFRIYLPIHPGDISDKQKVIDERAVSGSGETVLVVEDEMVILNLAERILSRLHYKVLLAKSPSEALDVAQAYPEEISLLLTDVVMPEMNGRELANQIQLHRPGIRCLFMSGYTADAIAHRGVLDQGVHFIQKPLSVEGLAVKVKEVLDEKAE